VTPRLAGLAASTTGERPAARATFGALFAVTLLVLLSIGATLPVLPQYVKGPIGSTDLAVGVVTGAYAITGLACRPLAGSIADLRGRKPVVIAGAIVTVTASLLYFLPLGVAGLVVARLILGAGEGVVYTASSAWVVDITDPGRRGRIIGLYGLAIWGGLSFGPPIGDLLHRSAGYGAVWAFAAAAPLAAALVAARIPEPPRPEPDPEARHRSRLFASEAVGPGLAMTMATLGYAALAGFIVLHLNDRGIDHGATIFTAFALTVVAARALFGWLPDRFGGVRCAVAAGLIEAAGLFVIAIAGSLAAALAGAIAVGAAFSLMFPSLVLLVIGRVPPQRRGIAMGTFTACFDLGVGLGAPIAGAAAALGGYGSSFAVAALAALGASALAAMLGRRRGPASRVVPIGAALCFAIVALAPGRASAADSGPGADPWVTENGYVTNLGRTEAEQREALESTVRAVHRWSGTLGVSDYRYFNLRDNVGSGTGLFDAVGLRRDDYAEKPAFGAYRRAIRRWGAPRP
jgi:MFS family permease